MTKDKMTLYQWLKENNMKIGEFSKKIGCHRQTPEKIECGKPVSLKIALAVRIITEGVINPTVRNVGRPKSINIPTLNKTTKYRKILN